MVRVVHREEVYEQVAGVGGATGSGIKVEVELDIEALLEYRWEPLNLCRISFLHCCVI